MQEYFMKREEESGKGGHSKMLKKHWIVEMGVVVSTKWLYLKDRTWHHTILSPPATKHLPTPLE